jgi:SAM-dependent methyltransferase
MRKTTSLAPEYFEKLYRDDPDPWDFETSDYEAGKYAETIKSLGSEQAASALEVGCANGVLTRSLADHCQSLLAIDVSATALRAAQLRCANLRHVTFRLAGIPDDAVTGLFDLIVLSEVAYYWDAADAERAAAIFKSQHTSGGRVLLVHWLGETDYPVSGDEAVERLHCSLGDLVQVENATRNERYRLDLWRWVR